MSSIQSDTIERALFTVLSPKCSICKEFMSYGYTTMLRCCNTLYHINCINDSLQEDARCPNRECRRTPNLTGGNVATALLSWLCVTRLSVDEINTMINGMYILNEGRYFLPFLRYLKKKTGVRFGRQFFGFYDLSIFSIPPLPMFQLPAMLPLTSRESCYLELVDNESYGLFRNFNWPGNLVLIGDNIRDHNAPLSLILFGEDYRTLRSSMASLFKQMETFGDAVVSIDCNVMTFYVRGFWRPVSVHIHTNSNLYQIIERLQIQTFFSTSVYVTAEFFLATRASDQMTTNQGKYCLKYNETLDEFRARTGLVVTQLSYNDILDSIFIIHYLSIKHNGTLKHIVQTCNKILDVIETVDLDIETPIITLHCNGSKAYFTGTLTEHCVLDFIKKMPPYKQVSVISRS